MEKDINICLSTDDNYIHHTAVVVASILSNAKNRDSYHFYILSTRLSSENKKKFNKLKKIKNCKIDYIDIDEKTLSSFKSVKMHSHLSLATYNRLLIPLLFPHLDKMIYLDSDLVVLSDISALNEIDVTDYYFAGVKDANSKMLVLKHGYNSKYEYINAGVIIINCAKLRTYNYFEKILKQIGKIEAQTGDQDFINYCFHKKIKLISYKWNMYHLFHFESYGGKQPLDDADYTQSVKHPVIIHFVGPEKPWNKTSTHPYKDTYLKYLKKTPWSYKIPEMMPVDIVNNDNLYPEKIGIISLGCDQMVQEYLTEAKVYQITEQNKTPFDDCYVNLKGVINTIKRNFDKFYTTFTFSKERGYWIDEENGFYYNKDKDCQDSYNTFKERIDKRIYNFKNLMLSPAPIFFILKASSDSENINILYNLLKNKRREKPFKLIVIDQWNKLKGLNPQIIHCQIQSPYKDNTQWYNPKYNTTYQAKTYAMKIIKFIKKEIKFHTQNKKKNGYCNIKSNKEHKLFVSLLNIKFLYFHKKRKENNEYTEVLHLLGIPVLKIKKTVKNTQISFFGIKILKISIFPACKKIYLFGLCILKTSQTRLNFLCLSIKQKGFYKIFKFLGIPFFFIKKEILSTAQTKKNITAIKKLKNKFKGKRCFIIGGSPSLKKLDLNKLNNEYTCTVGKGYKLAAQGLKHSSFHVFGDIFGYAETYQELDESYSNIYFFRSAIDCVNNIKNKIFFDTYLREICPASEHFQTDITKPLYCGATVVVYALQIMAYLGFSEIIFIGVDLDFNKIKDHAYEATSKEKDREAWSIHNQEQMYKSLEFGSKFLQKKVKIWNASPIGNMNFMHKIDYNKLFINDIQG